MVPVRSRIAVSSWARSHCSERSRRRSRADTGRIAAMGYGHSMLTMARRQAQPCHHLDAMRGRAPTPSTSPAQTGGVAPAGLGRTRFRTSQTGRAVSPPTTPRDSSVAENRRSATRCIRRSRSPRPWRSESRSLSARAAYRHPLSDPTVALYSIRPAARWAECGRAQTSA